MSHTELFSAEALARQEWIDACHFHDLNESEVLREVARRVSDLKAKAGGKKEAHPLVLLDLDSTLYEVQPRTHEIIREWATSDEAAQHPFLHRALRDLKPHHLGYSITDMVSNLGLDSKHPEVASAMADIKKYWVARFFTNKYLPFDKPYPGAAEFTRNLHALGAEIVYLTGRDEPGMGDGTRANLIRDGFPWETHRTHLLLKAAFHLPDLDHKRDAQNYIREHGTLVASFENEPANLIALHDIFPQAMHVFVHTVCSDHPAVPRQGLYRIRGFTHE